MPIEFEKPGELIEEQSKPWTLPNTDYPLSSIDHRRFEKLTYWIYKAELEVGDWQGKYDEIRLMSGIRDKARDCALFQNSEMTGIIQCKHSEKNVLLTKPIFVKEIIKFCLYCLIDDGLVKDPAQTEYYIASSSGFDEGCLDLIADFQQQICKIEEFEKWTQSVIKSYQSLKHLIYSEIEQSLKAFISRIKVTKIDDQDINRLLSKPYQIDTVKAFFEVKTVIDTAALGPIKRDIREIKARVNQTSTLSVDDVLTAFQSASCHLANWNSFFDINNSIHITRPQVYELIEWFQSPLEEEEIPLAILTGDGGLGKSVVLKDVYRSFIELDIPTLAIKSDKVYAKTIQGIEAELDLRKSLFEMLDILRTEYEKIVIIIDQIDALSQSLSSDRKFISTYNLLIEKLLEVQGVRIILSVRTFDLNYDPSLAIYKKGKIIKLSQLSDKEVKGVLSDLNIPSDTISKRLVETLRVPQHLRVFCELSQSDLSLEGIQELQDLYSELWRQKVIQIPATTNIDSEDCIKVIFELAEKMNELQQISVSKNIFDSHQPVIDYLVSCNIVINDGKELQFFHQSFYAYAKSFVKHNNSVLEYICKHSQSLHIRSSLKMILSYLRTTDEQQYAKEVTVLLASRDILFHIKLLVINLIGYNSSPSELEVDVVTKHILPNRKLRQLFLESIFGKKWIEVAIEKKLFDELINTKKIWIDKIASSRLAKRMSLVNIHSQLNQLPYEGRLNNNITLFASILSKNLPDSREIIVRYLLEVPEFEGKDWVVKRVLRLLEIWDFKGAFELYEKYIDQLHIKQDTYTFCHILGEIAPYDIDMVISEVKKYIIEEYSKESVNYEPRKMDYALQKLFEKLAWKDKLKTFKAGLDIIQWLSENNKVNKDKETLYSDYTFLSYFLHKRERVREDADNIYSVTIQLAESFAVHEPQTFRDFFNSYYQNNSISILGIIVHGLSANPENYVDEIVHFIGEFDAKGGFKKEVTLNDLIRELLGKSYSLFNQNQKDIVNQIILGISSESELRVHTNPEGRKSHFLRYYVSRKYRYLQSLPEEQVLAQESLRMVYLELRRKFGRREEEKMQATIGGIVEPPMSEDAYEKMNIVQWELTFIKHTTEEKGAVEHSRTFQKYVEKKPDKFFPLISKLIEENKVDERYWVQGIEGLTKSNHSPEQVLELFKMAISKVSNRENTLYLVWRADYFIKNQLVDDQIFCFLKEQAVNNSDPNQELNPNDPLSDGINSIRGAAIVRVIHCRYNTDWIDEIFRIAEKVAEDNMVSVRAALLYRMAFLIEHDAQRTIHLFLKTMTKDSERLMLTSIDALQYLVHHNFVLLTPHIRKWSQYKKEQGKLGAILTHCWLKGYKGSGSLLNNVCKISEAARASSVEIAIANLFYEDEKIKEKCHTIFRRFLQDKSEKVTTQYNHMFLHIRDKNYTFEQFLPCMKMYTKGNAVRRDPHYFFDYLLKYTASYPKECIDLISSYQNYPRPDIANGPYYKDEPIRIALSAYTELINRNDSVYVKKAIQLFDGMLQVDFLRKSAGEAMDLVER